MSLLDLRFSSSCPGGSRPSRSVIRQVPNWPVRSAFIKFGLTDSSIAQLAEGGHLVLTDDFRLSQFLNSKGHAVLNFNHVRVLGWK